MHNYLQAKYKRNTKISFPDSLGNHIRYLKSKIQLQAAYRRILSCQCTADSPQIDYERYLASRGQTQHGGRRNQEQQTQHTRISTIHGNRYEVCSFPHLLYKRNLHVKIIISVIAILRKKKRSAEKWYWEIDGFYAQKKIINQRILQAESTFFDKCF